GLQQVGTCDAVEERGRVLEQLLRRREVKDRRELALQVPGMEEELPVDELDQLGDVGRGTAHAGERRLRQVVERHARAVRTGGLERQQRAPHLLRMLRAQALLQLAVLGV